MSAPVFEQPDLRTKNVGSQGSSYQHPHTGAQVPSVTTISGLIDKSSFLGPWNAALAAEWAADHIGELYAMGDPDMIVDAIKGGAKRAREAGRDLGSLAHNTIEVISRGQVGIDIPDAVRPHVAGWVEWYQRYVKRFILIEETVWSHRHGYAGTLDVVAEFKDGTNILVDYKTGKEVWADAAMQLNALARADCVVTTDGEFPMPRIDGLAVLHLPAPILTATGKVSVRGKWSMRRVPMRDVEFDTFLSLLKAYRWEKDHAKTALGGKETMPVEPSIRAIEAGS